MAGSRTCTKHLWSISSLSFSGRVILTSAKRPNNRLICQIGISSCKWTYQLSLLHCYFSYPYYFTTFLTNIKDTFYGNCVLSQVTCCILMLGNILISRFDGSKDNRLHQYSCDIMFWHHLQIQKQVLWLELWFPVLKMNVTYIYTCITASDILKLN